MELVNQASELARKVLKIVVYRISVVARFIFALVSDGIAENVFQTYILIKKNLILYWRRLLSTLVQIFAPVATILLLLALATLINLVKRDVRNPPTIELSDKKFTTCEAFGSNTSCYLLSYAHNNNLYSHSIMNVIKQQYSLTDADVQAFQYEEEMVNWAFVNPNKTMTGISFSNTSSPIPGLNLTTYILYYNASGDVVPLVHQVQHALDNAITYLSLQAQGKAVDFGVIKTGVKTFPRPPGIRDGEIVIIGQTGANFFSLTTMFILITTMYFIVLEKENKIRIGMMTMGLKNIPYWMSWFICSMGINILNAMVTIVFGLICQLAFFRLTDFLVLFLLFTTYGMSLIALGFLLSTFVRSAKAALILGFVIFAVSFILNLFLTSGSVIHLLYGNDVPFPFYLLLAFYPPYNFAKIFADISVGSTKVLDAATGSYVDGPGYVLSQMTKLEPLLGFSGGGAAGGAVAGSAGSGTIPASIDSIYWLWANTAIFLVLAWYFDYVSPNGDHQKNFWFFIDPQFWGINFCSPKRIALHEVNLDQLDEDVRNEHHLARDKNADNVLRIVGLGKTFKSFFNYFGIGKEVRAVNDLDLTIKRGSCLGLLGHNGAGKTTTISILVGLIKSTFGDAMVNERSVKYELEKIRKTLGICPQHDILWPDLTAAEHLRLFAEFKGMSRNEIPPEIKQRLIDVDLLNVEHVLAGTFSGGMKRRLSVAIACIGDPEVILLDEPTTGMDPHSRRKVWKLIESMKGSRAILLTTHSMEEADALADRIAIMANGQLRCVGDSLKLKRKYGAGYNLNLMIVPEKIHELRKMIKQHVPEAVEASNNAGSVIYTILPEKISELGELLEAIENHCEETKDSTNSGSVVVRDWGISHTTLEEVYLKVTHEEFHDFDSQENDLIEQEDK